MQAPPSMRRGVALTLIALSVAVPGAAQSPGQRLHRFIPGDLSIGDLPAGVLSRPESAEDFRRAASGTGWSENREQQPSSSILHPRDNWEAVSRGMDADTRSPAGATLRYREVFTPAITPFKRTHAFDAVDELGRLSVRDPSMRPLRVGAVPSTWAREPVARFTADVDVELSGTTTTAVPSVAGDQAVLSYRSEPEVPLAFFHDSAGNLFVRAETARTVHLSYVIAAPQHAFVAPSGAVPDSLPGSTDLRGSQPEPAVPSFLAVGSSRVLTHVGARRSDGMRATLDTLVRYFRNYRDADLPVTPETNLYLRLALGGVGACRHRAYAFVLTLHALGVPARYVGNEAHAWAEVYLAGTGWSRVDLGGWDVRLRDEAQQREQFVPANPDPFPRPANYTNGYSTYGASAGPDDPRHPNRRRDELQNQGLGPGREDAAQPQPPSPEPQGAARTANGAATSGAQGSTGDGARGAPARGGGAATGVGGAARDEASTREDTAGSDSAARDGSLEEPERHRTELRLLSVQSTESHGGSVVRGTVVLCEGDARDEANAPVADLTVVFQLMQGSHVVEMMRNGRREAALGTTVTDERGAFRARVMLPLELEAGTYSIRVMTPGDPRHTRAQAE